MNEYNLRIYTANAKRREQIKVLRAQQWTWTKIARKFKITPQRAQQIGNQ